MMSPFPLRLLALCIVGCLSAQGGLRLPAFFADGMVLQRGPSVRLWGWAPAHAAVELHTSWGAAGETIEADAFGAFGFEFTSPPSAGPHALEVQTESATVSLADVWFGEVWLCAGQSNMEMAVGAIVSADAPELATAETAPMRFFDIGNAFAAAPAEDVQGQWERCSPETVRNFSAVAAFFGRRLLEDVEGPLGLITADWGGTVCEAWSSAAALSGLDECAADLLRLQALRGTPLVPRRPNWLHPNRPGVLFNGMIAPLAPSPERALALRGVLWYQGESNRGRAASYGRLFRSMIDDWRRAFAAPELPFYYVQIAPFGYLKDTGEAAVLRDVQRRCLSVAHTGMAVTMDVGDPGNLHPSRKAEVGERLARWALAGTYGKEGLAYAGPLFRGFAREEKTLRLFFDFAQGLSTQGGELKHFTLAGADGISHPAEARIEGETIVVWSELVPEPLEVRFGGGAADETDLYNAAGLPAASFIGDARDRR